jgi:hypothetical protein
MRHEDAPGGLTPDESINGNIGTLPGHVTISLDVPVSIIPLTGEPSVKPTPAIVTRRRRKAI